MAAALTKALHSQHTFACETEVLAMHDIIVPRRPTKSKPPRRHLPLVALSLAVVAAGLAVAAFFFGNYFFLLAGIVAYGAVLIGLQELRCLPITVVPPNVHHGSSFSDWYWNVYWYIDPANPANQNRNNQG